MSFWHYPYRSGRSELLDQENLPVEALHRNLAELALVNRWLGGYRISELALAEMQQHFVFHTLIDIGTGGGDTLQRLAAQVPQGITLEGWDLKADCIAYAQQHHHRPEISWVVGDFREALRSRPPGVLFHASLFSITFPTKRLQLSSGKLCRRVTASS